VYLTIQCHEAQNPFSPGLRLTLLGSLRRSLYHIFSHNVFLQFSPSILQIKVRRINTGRSTSSALIPQREGSRYVETNKMSFSGYFTPLNFRQIWWRVNKSVGDRRASFCQIDIGLTSDCWARQCYWYFNATASQCRFRPSGSGSVDVRRPALQFRWEMLFRMHSLYDSLKTDLDVQRRLLPPTISAQVGGGLTLARTYATTPSL